MTTVINKEEIPENYELAISMTAAEFLDEEIDFWIESIPEIQEKLIYMYDETQEMYKHQVWLPKELIFKLNDSFHDKSKIDLPFCEDYQDE